MFFKHNMIFLENSDNQQATGSASDDFDSFVRIVIYITLGVSIFCNFLIILIFLLFANLRKFPFILIYYMSLFCFLDDAVYLIGEVIKISDYSFSICLIHGFFVGFFGLLSSSYGAAIAYSIFLKTMTASKDITIGEKEKFIHVICFMISFFFSLMPFFNNNYDIDGNTCWIVDKDPLISLIMQIAAYYIVFWIETILVLYWFIKLVIFYKSNIMFSEENREIMGEQYKTAKQLLAYPIIMIVLVLIKTIYRIDIYLVSYSRIDIEFTSFVYFIGNSQGTMNFLVFGMTGIIKNRVKEKIIGCFQTPHSNTNKEDENLEIKRNNTEVFRKKEKEDIWENIDKNKIEEEIKNSLD